MANEIQIIGSKDNLNSLIKQASFQQAVNAIAGKYLTPERIFKMASLAHSRQPKLGQCTITSFMKEFIKCCELGLDCGGATGQGYLIPYKNGFLSKQANRDIFEATFIPGYQGLIEIAYRTGKVTYIDAQIVYAKDLFEYDLGSEPFVKFRPNLDSERGEVKCAFAIVRLLDSKYPKIEIMTKHQLDGIKSRSKAGDSGPWKTDEGEMMRKCPIRRIFKFIPKTAEVEKVLEADNRMYDFSSDISEESDKQPEQGVASVKKKIASKAIKEQIEQLKSEVAQEQVQPIQDDLPWDGPEEVKG